MVSIVQNREGGVENKQAAEDALSGVEENPDLSPSPPPHPSPANPLVPTRGQVFVGVLAAGAWAGLSLADGPLPFGEIVGGMIFGGAAANAF